MMNACSVSFGKPEGKETTRNNKT